MKLLTVAIPCYNSQDYMDHAIETAMTGGEDVEILLVDDGSTDDTARKADKYAEKHPDTIRVIHKENGGHGSAVNTGLQAAEGVYYKVLDSDDWFDGDAFSTVVETLRGLEKRDKKVDLFLCNYIYDKPSKNSQKAIRYDSVLPQNRIFTWGEVGHFKTSQNILMHSVIYRTQMLRDCGLRLPEHTFYVDNIFVYVPLPYVETMYYLNVDLYHYYIGREDQSVNEKVMIGRIDQQLKITKIIIDSHDLTKFDDNEELQDYMVGYLSMMMTVSSALLIKDGTEKSLKKKRELWAYLYHANEEMYKMVSNTPLGMPMQFRTPLGRKIVEIGYTIAQKVYGFN